MLNFRKIRVHYSDLAPQLVISIVALSLYSCPNEGLSKSHVRFANSLGIMGYIFNKNKVRRKLAIYKEKAFHNIFERKIYSASYEWRLLTANYGLQGVYIGTKCTKID